MGKAIVNELRSSPRYKVRVLSRKVKVWAMGMLR